MDDAMRRIEPVNSVWFFDEERSQFRRLPRDAEEVFARSDDFTVLLDPDGTRRYRSWLVESEQAPAEEATAEISVLPQD